MILEFPDSHAMNLLEVQEVGPVGGDLSWRRYIVYLKGGRRTEVYETRAIVDGKPARTMKRDNFIAKWKQALNAITPDKPSLSEKLLSEARERGTDF